MKKNQSGFTLVELLAVMVILGIIMVVALPNVTGILYKNRSATYVEDAKKLYTAAEYKFRGSNTGVVVPEANQCVVMSLAYLDNSEFEDPPNGGKYLKNESFVVIKKVAKGSAYVYEYYVQLLERIETGVEPRGISLVDSRKLYKEGATDLVDNFNESNLIGVSAYKFAFGNTASVVAENQEKAKNFANILGTSVVDCGTYDAPRITHIYAL